MVVEVAEIQHQQSLQLLTMIVSLQSKPIGLSVSEKVVEIG